VKHFTFMCRSSVHYSVGTVKSQGPEGTVPLGRGDAATLLRDAVLTQPKLSVVLRPAPRCVGRGRGLGTRFDFSRSPKLQTLFSFGRSTKCLHTESHGCLSNLYENALTQLPCPCPCPLGLQQPLLQCWGVCGNKDIRLKQYSTPICPHHEEL
jgi:hypothetical protein